MTAFGAAAAAELARDARRRGRDVVAPSTDTPTMTSDGGPRLLVTCADLATTPALGRCTDGAATASVPLRFGGACRRAPGLMADTTWPAADISPAAIAALPVNTVAVATDGSAGAVERARTILERQIPATVRARNDRRAARSERRRHQPLPAAGQRRAPRQPADRRLQPRRQRRRRAGRAASTVQPAPPHRRAAVDAAPGRSPWRRRCRCSPASSSPPAPGSPPPACSCGPSSTRRSSHPASRYYVLVVAGVAASLAIIASTLPLLASTTGPESARQD